MTTSVGRETARIYPFPVRARPAGGARGTDSRPAVANTDRLPMADCGGGWYHAAAIREAVRACEPQG